MLLTSSAYFVFLAGIVFLYWPLAGRRLAVLTLILFANYFFYAKWDLLYLGLIPAASLADFALARAIERWRSWWWLALSVALNLGLLAASRYSGSVPFAIGLSYYAFQSLSYTIDVYRGDAKASSSVLSYLCATSLFPAILAGPITRPAQLMPQWERPPVLTGLDGGRAFFLIATGAAKKFLIADYLGENLVNRVFDTPKLYSGFEALTAVYGYAFQLYYDFSGYSDIALGSAMLLGLRLPANFNVPYTARNLADFWRRWHMSLSNWLRDYVYFSFPGLRGRWMPYAALFLTMVLGGLWHGVSLNFLFWGALHGAGLAAFRAWQLRNWRLPGALAVLLTFHFVCLGWIFFRAADWNGAWTMLGRLASLTFSTANITPSTAMVLAIAAIGHFVPRSWPEAVREAFASRPFYVQAAAILLLVIGMQYVAATGSAPFLYTRF